MKFLIILIFATFLHYSQQSFNPFSFFSTIPRQSTAIIPTTPTSTNNVNYCNNRKRTWIFCTGTPPIRSTTDRCARRTEICGTGQAIASAFMQSFTAPIQVQTSNIGFSSSLRPSLSALRTSSSSLRPGLSSRRPSSSSRRPSTSSRRPSSSSRRPSTSSLRPSLSPRRPSTSSRRPSTSSRRPSSYGRRWGGPVIYRYPPGQTHFYSFRPTSSFGFRPGGYQFNESKAPINYLSRYLHQASTRLPSNTTPMCTSDTTLIGGSFGNCNVHRRTKRQSSGNPRTFSDPNRDIIILLDESGSINEVKFKKVKQLASSIVKLLCENHDVHPERTRVGVTSFDAKVHPHIWLLDTHPSKREFNTNGDLLAQAIMSIRYNRTTHGKTCLYNALQYTNTVSFLSSRGGRRNDLNIVKEIIVITDGCANCGGNLVQMRDTLVAANTNVYVIGVGLSRTCREKIKILAQGGKCNHFFFMDFWENNFDAFIQSIVEQAKKPEVDREWCIRQIYDSARNCP